MGNGLGGIVGEKVNASDQGISGHRQRIARGRLQQGAIIADTKQQIGAIKTFPEETRFEIAKTHEAAFREAEARERLAEAEAKATQLVSDAIANGNVQAINYFVAQKYIEAFKALAEAPNQKFVMMPMESAGVIGSLGGIAELAKQALEQPGRATTKGG